MLTRRTHIGLVIFAVMSVGNVSLTVGQEGLANLVGKIEIDGSSTVAPISMAVADAFAAKCPKVSVPVLISGTGGGFKRFVIGETDISDASRPIKKAEQELAKANSIGFYEIPIAYDGLTLVIHPSNDWVKQLTMDQVKKLFNAESPAKKWSDVDPTWPAREIKIFSPGTDSGTFDYFKEVVGGTGAIREDISVSEDDNQLVMGVAKTPDAIGFFGVSYYVENKDKLKAIPIVNPRTNQPVSPTTETISSGDYAPFSRPLFIYVNAKSCRRPEVRIFVEFYLDHAAELAEKVGYVKLPSEAYARAKQVFKSRKTGSFFTDKDGNVIHGALLDVYTVERPAR